MFRRRLVDERVQERKPHKSTLVSNFNPTLIHDGLDAEGLDLIAVQEKRHEKTSVLLLTAAKAFGYHLLQIGERRSAIRRGIFSSHLRHS